MIAIIGGLAAADTLRYTAYQRSSSSENSLPARHRYLFMLAFATAAPYGRADIPGKSGAREPLGR
eukprot:5399490-Amphidinium_carterae.1